MLVFGRANECDFQLLNPRVSREHFAIKKEEDDFILIDLGSKNGTYCNGELLRNETIKLNHGDRIKAGDYRFLYIVERPEQSVQDILTQVANSLESQNIGFRTAMLDIIPPRDG